MHVDYDEIICLLCGQNLQKQTKNVNGGSWLLLDLPLFTGVIYCSKFTGKLHLVAPWQWTSYPSGRSAIVYCSAGAELGRSGYYLIAYDDSNDHRMLACFTPAGKGVCYSTNGNIRFFDDSLIFWNWIWPLVYSWYSLTVL